MHTKKMKIVQKRYQKSFVVLLVVTVIVYYASLQYRSLHLLSRDIATAGSRSVPSNQKAEGDRAPATTPEFRRHRVRALQIPTPVFVLSLPKSGTTSVFRYFVCGGIPSAHTHRFRSGSWERLGDCLRNNFHNQHTTKLLDGCGPYQVWSDLGVIGNDLGLEETNKGCFYPSLQALERIASDYPNATLIVSYREAKQWFESVQRWSSLVQRWIQRCPLFPNTTDATEWQTFYEYHRWQIRSLVKRYVTLNYLELDLADPTMGQQLETITGISAQCWGHCRPETGECMYT